MLSRAAAVLLTLLLAGCGTPTPVTTGTATTGAATATGTDAAPAPSAGATVGAGECIGKDCVPGEGHAAHAFAAQAGMRAVLASAPGAVFTTFTEPSLVGDRLVWANGRDASFRDANPGSVMVLDLADGTLREAVRNSAGSLVFDLGVEDGQARFGLRTARSDPEAWLGAVPLEGGTIRMGHVLGLGFMLSADLPWILATGAWDGDPILPAGGGPLFAFNVGTGARVEVPAPAGTAAVVHEARVHYQDGDRLAVLALATGATTHVDLPDGDLAWLRPADGGMVVGIRTGLSTREAWWLRDGGDDGAVRLALPDGWLCLPPASTGTVLAFRCQVGPTGDEARFRCWIHDVASGRTTTVGDEGHSVRGCIADADTVVAELKSPGGAEPSGETVVAVRPW